VEFTRGSALTTFVGYGPATAATRRGKEAVPAQPREGAKSAGEPLIPALPRWSTRDWGRRRRYATVLRAARGSTSWPAHAEATLRLLRWDARPHRSKREMEGVALEACESERKRRQEEHEREGVALTRSPACTCFTWGPRSFCVPCLHYVSCCSVSHAGSVSHIALFRYVLTRFPAPIACAPSTPMHMHAG
jgi:hypothetical protein